MNAHVKPTTPDYVAGLPQTELLRISVALATELYAVTDRLHALEEVLAARGFDLSALDAPTEPAAFDPIRKQRRDEFVERVFGALARVS